MELSFAGAMVCAGLLAFGYVLRAPFIIALFGSLAFGSTAIATVSSLGGSSPLISAAFAGLLLLTVLFRRDGLRNFRLVFAEYRTAWIVCALTIYAALGAVILPRLFAGSTSAFVPSRTMDILEVPLAPVSGNITQAAYFALGAILFLSMSNLLLQGDRLRFIRQGYFIWATMHAALGLIHLGGKLAQMGDVLLPIRSASYAMQTDAREAGFIRITGGQSEASAFGGIALACLAFSFTYWRRTGSTYAFGLSVTLLLLILFSTASTAYVGLVIIAIPMLLSAIRSTLTGRFTRRDLLLYLLVLLAVIVAMFIQAYDGQIIQPFIDLFDSTILNKASSASGQERSYWNTRSLESFFDTATFGIGLGSSRASSWIIAVLSQLGLAGALMLIVIIAELARRVKPKLPRPACGEVRTLHDAVRASVLTGLVAGSLVSGTADPGFTFFIGVAVVLACRRELEREGTLRCAGSSGRRLRPQPRPRAPVPIAGRA